MLSWLRRLQPYLLLTLLALPALWPLTHAGLPRTNDNLPHFYRLVELDRLIRGGVLFPRWAPDLVHGYGYPVFNFFPYLSHLLAESFHLLGLDLLGAFKAAYMTVLLCAVWSAYRLGREHFGDSSGLVTGLAYLYSPYLLYNVHIRGALPESLALALLPLAMLYVRRAVKGDRRSAVWAGLILGACVFAHNAIALQIMPFLFLYGLWETISGRKGETFSIRGFIPLAFVFLFAFMLSSFYWLPALTEMRYVQFDNAIRNSSLWYFDHLLSLSELTALPRLPVDPDLLNPPVVRSLPLVAIGLAALGVARWRSFSRPSKVACIFFSAAALMAVFFILPVARPLWDRLPLLQLTLFPWRLLGLVTLFTALLAGAALADGEASAGSFAKPLAARRWSSVALGASSFILVLAGLPFASPPFESAPSRPTLADVAASEMPPWLIGTTTSAEFLPIWVKQLPDTSVSHARLMAGEPLDRYRIVASSAPDEDAGASVTVTERRTRGDAYDVVAGTPVTFVYQAFYFPGWRASLNDNPVPIRITEPDGLMAVDLPAGRSALTFEFGSTPVRVLGTILSLIGLGIGIVVPITSKAGQVAAIGSRHSLPGIRWLFLLGAGLAIARPVLYDAGLTPLLRRGLQPDGLAGVAHPLTQDFAGEVILLGWDADQETVAGDQLFEVNLYWRAGRDLGVPYGFNVRLVGADGLTWSEANPQHPRDWRFIPGTDFWPLDQYILDSYELMLLTGTPPGSYSVEVSVFSRHSLQSIGAAQFGPLTIQSPSRTRACATDSLATFAEDVQLQAANVSQAEASPGDDVNVSLCWRALQSPLENWSGTVRLLTEHGTPVFERTFQIGGAYPTSEWEAGDTVRDQLVARLPADIDTGNFTWVVEAAGRSIPIGRLHVTAPSRTFAAPAVSHVLSADLGPVTLFGYDLRSTSIAPGNPLDVTLYWRADQVLNDSYHVFVHLIDAQGGLVAQSDGVPANWTRLTTGWLPGEYVMDSHSLQVPADLPPGKYQLFVGLYLLETGERLATEEFPEGRVQLQGLEVG